MADGRKDGSLRVGVFDLFLLDNLGLVEDLDGIMAVVVSAAG